MIITQPTLKDIPFMRELLAPEVERGIILERPIEVMANMIRSYHIAWEEEEILQTQQKLHLSPNNLEELKRPKMLGFCALHIHSQTLAEIRSLVVAPFMQRKGIATALILDCIKEGVKLNISEILVLTYKKVLFEKLGFIEIPKEKIPNQKIWADCILCKHFPLCDEVALIKHI